jgi:hypothetical protein
LHLTDLNALGIIPDPRMVKVDGVEYLLPGDIPATLMMRFLATFQGAQDALELAQDPDATDEAREKVGMAQLEQAQDLHDELLAAFQVHQPDLERLPFGAQHMVAVVNAVYQPLGKPADEAGPTKPAAKKRTTTRATSTPTRRKPAAKKA